MGFFDLFKKQAVLQPVRFDALLVVMHSHLIPGIDDGSKSMDETIAMLAKFESLGYKKVITTPHIYGDCYRNTPEIIRSGLKDVQEVMQSLGLKIQLDAAAEYHCDEYFMEQLKAGNLLSIEGKYILMEFPFMSELDNWKDFVFSVQAKGFVPIIAHFERYVYWHGSIAIATEMRELGCAIQVNANSLSNHYGSDVRKQAEKLIDAQMVDFFATDCHRIQHLLLMESNANLPYMHKVMHTNTLLNSKLIS